MLSSEISHQSKRMRHIEKNIDTCVYDKKLMLNIPISVDYEIINKA